MHKFATYRFPTKNNGDVKLKFTGITKNFIKTSFDLFCEYVYVEDENGNKQKIILIRNHNDDLFKTKDGKLVFNERYQAEIVDGGSYKNNRNILLYG